MYHDVYLSLGSNMGDRAGNCLKAIKLLGNLEETKLVSQSSLYETEPVGYENQSPFINMAVKIKTSFDAPELLTSIKVIETSMGRVKTFKWGPRLIDIDVLFFDDEIISKPGLHIPHPALAERAFVLLPLTEIGGELKHPVNKMTILEMARNVSGKEGVKRIL